MPGYPTAPTTATITDKLASIAPELGNIAGLYVYLKEPFSATIYESATPTDSGGNWSIANVPLGVTYQYAYGIHPSTAYPFRGTYVAANPPSTLAAAVTIPAGGTALSGGSLGGYESNLGAGVINLLQPKYRAIGTWDPVAGTGDIAAALIQAIADLGSAGGAILLPAGLYNVASQVTGIASNVKLVGVGPGTQIQTALQSGINLFLFTNASVGAVVQQIWFSCSATTGASLTGLDTNASIDVTIWGCRFTGGFTQAVLVYFGSSCRVQGCHFDSIGNTSGGSTPGDAINVFNAFEVSVVGNTFRNCLQDACYFGSSAQNCSFSGNTVVGTPEGVQIRVSCSNITVTGNSFNITPSAVVNSFAVILQTDSVDCTVTGNVCQTTGTAAHPLAAIAVQVRCHRTVVSGNTVNGYYNKGILVLTTGAGGTESLDCAVVGNAINGTASYGIHVAANENGSTIAANSLRATGDNGIQCSASRTAITGNKVRGALNQGIACGGTLNTVVGNHVSDSSTQGIAAASTLSTYVGNVCYNNSAYGINESGSQNVILGNILNTNTSGPLTSTSITSQHINNIGYNPVGVVVPAVPASTVAVAAVSYWRTFYVTTGASTCTMAIQNGSSPVIPANSFGTIRVPATKTVTPTYANAPTWVVDGE